MKDVKQGDMVWVTSGRGATELREVVKVGRTLVHIDLYGRTETFRLDAGRINDGRGNTSFRTQAEQAEMERRSAAVVVLREAGLELTHRRTVATGLLEALAEVAKTFGTEKEGEAR